MMRRLFLCVLLGAGLSVAQAAPLRIGFLCPSPAEHPFWKQVIQAMRAAANDLQIELVVKCDEHRTTYTTKKIGTELLNSEPRLDYFLSGYWTAVTRYHLEQAQKRNIRVMTFNSDVVDADRRSVGQPRERYPNWLGQMVPDDLEASMTLTQLLVNRATQVRRYAKDGKIHVVGFGTNSVTASGKDRRQGLMKQVAAMPAASLREAVLINRSTEVASDVIHATLKNNLETAVIWTSSEAIMHSAVDTVVKIGTPPGKDIFIGGFDWNVDNLQALADGEITASMFGHFLEGAWALILAHDYHHGFEFVDQTGVRINTPLKVMNTDNVARYKEMFSPEFWEKVDFRKFSKKYNPELKSYDFSIEQFLE
jgi:ABC-type sugar transport system substrate-binding protein